MSQVTAAQDAFESLLGTACTGHAVCYGIPLKMPELAAIVMPDADTAYVDTDSGVTARMDEDFALACILHAHRSRLTHKELRAIADTAEAAVESALASDPTLGGTVSHARIAAIGRRGGDWGDGAVFDERLVTVRCRVW